METKICSKCKEDKNVWEFNKSNRNKSGLRAECKNCQVNYYVNNRESVKKRRKERYSENRVKELVINKIYYDNNKSEIIKNLKIKRKINHTFRLKNNVRSRLIQFLNSLNIHKDNKTFDIVGCSPELLKEHIEKQFKEGMSWDNYGLYGWHIDHIIPLSLAKTEEEVYKLCHYTNLQPLWAKENLSKSNKIL